MRLYCPSLIWAELGLYIHSHTFKFIFKPFWNCSFGNSLVKCSASFWCSFTDCLENILCIIGSNGFPVLLLRKSCWLYTKTSKKGRLLKNMFFGITHKVPPLGPCNMSEDIAWQLDFFWPKGLPCRKRKSLWMCRRK